MTKQKINPTKAKDDLTILEEANIAFDPTTQHLDLSVAEKRRTTSLLMAIQAYSHLIIRDAEMYIAMKSDERRGDGLKIKPATVDAIVETAIKFDLFIRGTYQTVTVKDVLVTHDTQKGD